MRKLLLILSLSGMCLQAVCQDYLGSLVSSLNGSCATCSYSFKVSGDLPLNGSGTLTVQGDAFAMSGNGLDLFCDGTTRWTVDRGSEECYIESVDAEVLDLSSNPALILGSLDQLFKKGKTSVSSHSGQPTTAISLAPISSEVGFSSAVAHFLKDGTLCALVLNSVDGSVIDITISDMKIKTPVSLDPTFTLDISSLGKNYIITDLR